MTFVTCWPRAPAVTWCAAWLPWTILLRLCALRSLRFYGILSQHSSWCNTNRRQPLPVPISNGLRPLLLLLRAIIRLDAQGTCHNGLRPDPPKERRKPAFESYGREREPHGCLYERFACLDVGTGALGSRCAAARSGAARAARTGRLSMPGARPARAARRAAGRPDRAHRPALGSGAVYDEPSAHIDTW